MKLNVLLISTYEMGRQPFGLASPAAWLRQLGAEVHCLDLSIDPLNPELVRAADLVAFYVPMHMATRMAVPVIAQVQRLNPRAHLCCFGLYAPVSADYLRRLGVDTILGGEFETGLVHLVQRISESANQQASREPSISAEPTPLSTPHPATLSPCQPLILSPPYSVTPSAPHLPFQAEPLISLDRQTFLVPDRSGLPDLARYAHLVTSEGQHQTAGYVEASRGCKHLCRHCPIVPVYQGHFRVVQREVILADIRQQVAAGAQHLTFGDPDFFNGPGHALPLVKALHQEFPRLTYDVTIKVEHLLDHAAHLETLKKTGCLFVTSAVESFDDHILTLFAKRHTRADFVAALNLCRQLDLLLVPTFVAFTPWTTLANYRAFLAELVRLELVDQVSPIQCAIRLLIPPGSRLLELPETQAVIAGLDETKLSYHWRNPDPRVDELQHDLEYLVQRCAGQHIPRREVFRRVWQRAYQAMSDAEGASPYPELPAPTRPVPHLSEPWYC